jgi:hypothetical protein
MPPRTPPVLSLWILWASLSFQAVPLSQAFVSVPHPNQLPCTITLQQSTLLFASNNYEGDTSTRLSHSDVEWLLRPPEGTSRLDRLKIKLGAKILRLESKIKGGGLPPVLLPRGGRALLEAYHKGKNGRRTQVRSCLPALNTKNADAFHKQSLGVGRRKLLDLGLPQVGVRRLLKVSDCSCSLEAVTVSCSLANWVIRVNIRNVNE